MNHDLTITRIFNAPVALVWRAWTDPAFIRRWWGPDRFECPMCRVDFREGGTTLVCMRAPKEFGGQDMYSTWAYTKIVPMQRIEYIHNLADKDGNKLDPAIVGMPPDFPKDQLHVISFKDLREGRTELTINEHGWSPGQMRNYSEIGMNQCLDKMAAIFTS